LIDMRVDFPDFVVSTPARMGIVIANLRGQ
jgi:hypothetical protein